MTDEMCLVTFTESVERAAVYYFSTASGSSEVQGILTFVLHSRLTRPGSSNMLQRITESVSPGRWALVR